MKPCPQCGHSWGSGVRDQSRLSLAVASRVASGSVVSLELSRNNYQNCLISMETKASVILIMWTGVVFKISNITKC